MILSFIENTRDDGPVLELYSAICHEFSSFHKATLSLSRESLVVNLSDYVKIDNGSISLISVMESNIGEHLITDAFKSFRIVLQLNDWRIFSGLLEPFMATKEKGRFQWMTGRNAGYLCMDDINSVVVSFDDKPHF